MNDDCVVVKNEGMGNACFFGTNPGNPGMFLLRQIFVPSVSACRTQGRNPPLIYKIP